MCRVCESAPAFVPAELPARFAIDFIPANARVSSSPSCSAPSVVLYVLPVASASVDYSVVSSTNFIISSFPNDVSPSTSAPYADNVRRAD